jgi:hypothetical protein
LPPPDPGREPDPAIESALASTRRVGGAMLAAIGLRVGLSWVVRAINLAYLASDRMRGSSVADTERTLVAMSGAVGFAGIVLFLVWIYQAARNVRALGLDGLTLHPWMCVASFFIPIASIYLPYKAVAEIATASDANGRGRVPMFVPIWWLLFLAQGILAIAGSFLLGAGADIQDRVVVNVAAGALETGSLVALALTVRFIARAQEHWARH